MNEKTERDREFEDAMNDGEIICNAGIIKELADKLEYILSANNSGVYQRGGILVSISKVPVEVKDGLTRRGKPHIISPVTAIRLRELGSHYGLWKKWYERNKEYKRIDCPRDVAETLWNRTEWQLPFLKSVLCAPTIGPDGEIISTPGYNEGTGIYLFIDDWKPIEKVNPSRDDAVEARELIEDLVKEFPFVDKACRSAWVACFLTSLVRWSLRTAPFFGYDAPVMATGKSLLAELIGILCNGREPATMNHSADPMEAHKKLLASLLAGDPVLLIDNIEHPIYGESLCSVATSETYRDRMLGKSQMVTVSTAVTIMLNGNNLTIRGDLSTRVLMSRLDAGVEHPEEREFDRDDIRKYAFEHRHALVNAALTIFRAYEVAGRPDVGLAPFGRFEEWSMRVRAPLVWCGAEDPCNTRTRVESSDPEREMHAALISAWWEVYETKTITIREIIHDITSSEGENFCMLAEAIAAFAGEGNRINRRKFGNRLRRWEGRVCEGKKITAKGEVNHSKGWCITDLSGERGYRGSRGFSYSSSGNTQRKYGKGVEQTPITPITPFSENVREKLQKACTGFDLTVEQLISFMDASDIADVESGVLTEDQLTAWAEHFDQKLKSEDSQGE